MLASGGSPSIWFFIPTIILLGIGFVAGIYSIFGGPYTPSTKSRKPTPEPKRPLTKEEQEEIRIQKQEEWIRNNVEARRGLTKDNNRKQRRIEKRLSKREKQEKKTVNRSNHFSSTTF